MSRLQQENVTSYSWEEAMICNLSRELRNHEIIGVGNNSPIPAAASLLAKSLHAKQASVYILGQCDWPFEGTREFFDLMQRGEMDVFFLSGAQIDSYGRINLQVIGDYGKPKVRLPGGAGSGVVYFTSKRILLFKTDHGLKGFPETLDFVTSTPSTKQGVYHQNGLVGVYTPLGVMKPNGPQRRLKLAATVPGVKPAEVQGKTGFDLGLKNEAGTSIPTLDPPSAVELAKLRYEVSHELRRIYPLFAKQHFGTYMKSAAVQS
jgi:glutaconate CoA-transferase subunit B